MNPFRPGFLADKVAFVAGGTSGINLAIAHGLAQYGAKVAVMSRNAGRVESAVAALLAHGDTEGMARLAPTDAIRERWAQMNPMRRFGTGHDVAQVALFLCSDAAGYVNGTIVYCDGGQVLAGGRDYRESWRAMKAAQRGAKSGPSAE